MNFKGIYGSLKAKKIFVGGFFHRDPPALFGLATLAFPPISFAPAIMSGYKFSVSHDLTQMVNFPTQIPECNSHSLALLDLFIFSDASICSIKVFLPFRNSGHVLFSVSIHFPSYSQQDALFHYISYDYSPADWDGLHDHLRDVPWEDIFKLSSSAGASKFFEWVEV